MSDNLNKYTVETKLNITPLFNVIQLSLILNYILLNRTDSESVIGGVIWSGQWNKTVDDYPLESTLIWTSIETKYDKQKIILKIRNFFEKYETNSDNDSLTIINFKLKIIIITEFIEKYQLLNGKNYWLKSLMTFKFTKFMLYSKYTLYSLHIENNPEYLVFYTNKISQISLIRKKGVYRIWWVLIEDIEKYIILI